MKFRPGLPNLKKISSHKSNRLFPYIEMHSKSAVLAGVPHFVGQWHPAGPTQMAPSVGLATRAVQLENPMAISKFGAFISKFGRYYYTVPYRTIPYLIPYRTVPYRTVPYRTVPYRTVPYRTVPSDSQFPNIVT